MPLQYKISSIPSALIYIWKIEEDESFFLQNMFWHTKQLEWLNSIHPIKKLEYLASRYLISKITGKLDSHLYKNEAGKLFIKESNKNISVSHSGEWVGIALSEKIIGFDLQKQYLNIKSISKKFLNQEEQSVLLPQDDDQLLIIAWTIKEAIYKANGKKGILFSEQILLDLTHIGDEQIIENATLKHIEYEKKYKIHHDWMENFGYAIALEA
jgi:phosphopantetheinyl transferase